MKFLFFIKLIIIKNLKSNQLFEDAIKAKCYSIDKNFYKKLTNSMIMVWLGKVIKANGLNISC